MKIDRESIEPTVEAGWRDPALRAEFNGNRDAYAAYELAVARGQARVYGPAHGRATNFDRVTQATSAPVGAQGNGGRVLPALHDPEVLRTESKLHARRREGGR